MALCAFYGLFEHKGEIFHGILKGLFYIFCSQKANEKKGENVFIEGRCL